MTFQGGFVGTRCLIEIADDGGKPGWKKWTNVYPEDVNRRQTFDLQTDGVQDKIQSLRIVFEESSDFFGRVTVYDLQLLGQKFE